MAAAARRAGPASISLFGLHILFGTIGPAYGPAFGPVPGSGAGRTCRSGATTGREPVSPRGEDTDGPRTSGTAAGEAGPAGQQLPGPVRLAGMLTLSCLISPAGQATVTFAGELDAASADQSYGYIRDAIDGHGGPVLLHVAGLSFCDARGLAALARMSRHARQAGSSVHLVAPPPRLMKIIRITGLQDTLPVHHADQADHAQVA